MPALGCYRTARTQAHRRIPACQYRRAGAGKVTVWATLRASLSGTFLQTLLDLVTPLSEGALFISAQLSSDAVSTLRKVRVLIRLWKQPSAQART